MVIKMEPEQKTKATVNIKAKILAVASVIIALLCIPLDPILMFFCGYEKIDEGIHLRLYSGLLTCFIAFLCGIISLISLRKVKNFWFKTLAWTGCILSVLLALLITGALGEWLCAQQIGCSSNIDRLSQQIKTYCANHNGEFPDPSKWCDLLLSEPKPKYEENFSSDEYRNLLKKSFICSAALKQSQSTYAFNKNLAGKRISEVDPNVVVLFETTAIGWNQNGGPEIMCPDRHKHLFRENSSNVLYPSVEFVSNIKSVPQSEAKNLHWNP